MVVRPFSHLGRDVSVGQFIELEAIDAAVKAREGLVSLLHGAAYRTRHLVADVPASTVLVAPSSAQPSAVRVEIGPVRTETTADQADDDVGADDDEADGGDDLEGGPKVSETAPKRRRGRPRKVL